MPNTVRTDTILSGLPLAISVTLSPLSQLRGDARVRIPSGPPVGSS